MGGAGRGQSRPRRRNQGHHEGLMDGGGGGDGGGGWDVADHNLGSTGQMLSKQSINWNYFSSLPSLV